MASAWQGQDAHTQHPARPHHRWGPGRRCAGDAGSAEGPTPGPMCPRAQPWPATVPRGPPHTLTRLPRGSRETLFDNSMVQKNAVWPCAFVKTRTSRNQPPSLQSWDVPAVGSPGRRGNARAAVLTSALQAALSTGSSARTPRRPGAQDAHCAHTQRRTRLHPPGRGGRRARQPTPRTCPGEGTAPVQDGKGLGSLDKLHGERGPAGRCPGLR